MSLNIWLILLSQLGSNDYQTREKAHCALYKNSGQVEIQLLLLEKNKNIEISRRANLLLNRYYEDNAEKWMENTCKNWPWVYEVYGNGLGQYYLEKARQVTGVCGPDQGWHDYRYATKLWVTDLYRERKTKTEVLEFLQELKNQEEHWTKNFGQRYYPNHFDPKKVK